MNMYMYVCSTIIEREASSRTTSGTVTRVVQHKYLNAALFRKLTVPRQPKHE